MVWAIWISGIATAFIAFYAFRSHELAKRSLELAQEIKKTNELKSASDDKFRQQVTDLYEAIVISNVIHPPQKNTTQAIKQFREFYKGETPIF